MGLLTRALVAERKSENSFSPDIQQIMTYLNSSSSGLDFPSKLFSQIKNEFQITKGAILLPEDESRFIPLAETGFDRTTSRRIRIPQTLINSIKSWDEYNILELSDSEIGVMSDFFSFREFSVTNSILLAPILADSKLIAIVFICEGEILKQSRNTKIHLFSQLSNNVGPLLFNKRESILNKMENVSQNDGTKEEVLKLYIEKNKDSEFLVLSVDVKNFMDFILENDSSAISFRIKQDILRLIKTLIADRGEVVNNNSNSLLILINGNRIKEAELLVHQIGLSISYFFKVSSNQFKPNYLIKKYPEDGNTVEELLSSLNSK